MEILIRTYGVGTIFNVSSSYNGVKFVSYDTNGSGRYLDGFNYKFLLSNKYVTIVARSGNVTSSSIDRSFIVLKTTTTASIDVVFYPEKPNTDNVLVKKIDNGASTIPVLINGLNASAISSQNVSVVQSGRTLPTAADYAQGFMVRYFYRQSNNVQSPVREINDNQYADISSNSLYLAIQLRWKISGEESNVESTNRNIVAGAESQLPGIKYLLGKNLTQYFIPSTLTQQI